MFFDILIHLQGPCPTSRLSLKVLSSVIYRGRNQAQTIRIDEQYCRQVCFFNYKGTPSREKHKTSFSVLTIGLNLLAEFTKSCKRRAPYNDLEIHLLPASTTHVPYNHQLAQISRDSWILSMYGTILHNYTTVQVPYRTVFRGKKHYPAWKNNIFSLSPTRFFSLYKSLKAPP